MTAFNRMTLTELYTRPARRPAFRVAIFHLGLSMTHSKAPVLF